MPKREREPGNGDRPEIRSADRQTAGELFARSHAIDHSRDAARPDATMLKPALSPCRSSAGRERGA